MLPCRGDSRIARFCLRYAFVSGDDVLGVPPNKRIPQNNQSTCHPERSRTSAERIARQKRETFRSKRDLVGSLGGFLKGCNIPLTSHPNSFRDPIVATLLGFSSLLARKNFDYAKRKRFSPLRMTYRGFVLLKSIEAGCPGGHPLQGNI
jgi:hypothetical protein